ncbi:unnamed protein product [Enterobius vermicularis]|uniref:MFS_1_like domain-containing protein n=1 Tax=Enterobius vermicularis TaxID=51028 RepID=A0A0N4UZS6_ENTVE|nr:unnamed protein product [Enterobius vermicularis]
MYKKSATRNKFLAERGPPISCLAGRSIGTFFAGVLDELHWSYRIPAFVVVTVCLLSTVFAVFRYEFKLVSGLFQITLSYSRNDGNERPLQHCAVEQNQWDIERKPAALVRDLLQKSTE